MCRFKCNVSYLLIGILCAVIAIIGPLADFFKWYLVIMWWGLSVAWRSWWVNSVAVSVGEDGLRAKDEYERI